MIPIVTQFVNMKNAKDFKNHKKSVLLVKGNIPALIKNIK